MGLARYRQKRDFLRTAEPKGGQAGKKGRGRGPRFVIQKHAARQLHYDFRLEMEGVLKSWAVPKGIPVRKGDKRLAMQVEDHPLEYGGFEGTIPAGNYGAGTVMLWDTGTWELLGGEPSRAFREGKLHFELKGKKLKGEWTLVRMKGRGEPGKEPWLLLKSGQDARAISRKRDDESVASGKTMKQIAAGRGKVWESNRKTASSPAPKRSPSPPARSGKAPVGAQGDWGKELKGLPKSGAAFIDPMKARLVEKPPRDAGWIFEIKWDGYRALAVKKEGKVKLCSRSEKNMTADFPAIVDALEELAARNLVADGEIVALDGKGRPSFQLMQNYRQKLEASQPRTICYYLFDLLNLENRDLRKRPLAERKERLKRLLAEAEEPLRFSAGLRGDPDELLAMAREKRLEGLIAKREDSPYESGRRSKSWLKIKCVNEQEFVVGGYTPPQGTRKHFGSILAGYYDRGKLLFASRVGTGFDTATLESLHKTFQKLRTDRCPFENLPARGRSRWSQGLTPSEMRRCTWLKPELVAQVRFSEWTSDGGLRHPVFLGLRDDKKPLEVVREGSA